MGSRSTSRERGRRALAVSWRRSASPSGWPDIAHFAPSPLEPSSLASVVSIRKWLSSTPPAAQQVLSLAGSPARAIILRHRKIPRVADSVATAPPAPPAASANVARRLQVLLPGESHPALKH